MDAGKVFCHNYTQEKLPHFLFIRGKQSVEIRKLSKSKADMICSDDLSLAQASVKRNKT